MRRNVKTGKEGLGNRIGNTVAFVMRRALLIVCLESILIAGYFAIMYNLNDNRSSAKEYIAEIDCAMQSKITMLEAIAAGISSGTITETADVQNYVDSMVETDNQISAVYSSYDDNILIMSGGWQPPEDFIVTEREWYKKAQEKPESIYISDPYVDEQSGDICITLSKATYINGQVAGVVGMDMYIDDLVSLIEGSYKGSAYVFLATADGTILVHPNEKYSISVDSSTTVLEANSGRYKSFVEGNMFSGLFLDYQGGLKFGIGNTSEMTGWKVVSIKPLSQTIVFLVLILVLNGVIYVITMTITGKRMNEKVSVLFKPLESISDKVAKMAQGDLSIKFDEEKNSTEIERLTDSLNDTVTSLGYYINSISDTVTAISDKDLTVTIHGDFKGSYVQIKEALETIISNLNETFLQIKREAKSVMDFAKQLEKTTETVAEGAEVQNGAVSDVSVDMERLTKEMKLITKHAMNVRSTTETTNGHLEVGNREIKALVKAMDSIEQCYSQIADFVEAIKDIASQTNLLALNASIEAARAGEVGKGFAVVADEISTLAESSTKASESIDQLIAESQSAVSEGKKLVTETSETMEQGMSDSAQAKQYINEIVEHVESQQKEIESVNKALQEIARMVEYNAASAEENTAISQQLSECAQNLKQTSDSFQLR